MVGRHNECQIRPHSQSIDERHCLLEHRHGLLRVFDLESDGGSFVNGDKLSPHKWRFLKNGDQLRCGKLAFFVCIDSPVAKAKDTSAGGAANANSNTALQGEPRSVEAGGAKAKQAIDAKAIQPTKAAAAGNPSAKSKDADRQLDDAADAFDDAANAFEDADSAFDALDGDASAFEEDDDSSTMDESSLASGLADANKTAATELDGLFDDDGTSDESDDSLAEAKVERADPETSDDPNTGDSTPVKKPLKPVSQEKLPGVKDSKKIKRPKAPKIPKSSGSRSFSMPSLDFSNPEGIKLIGAVLLTVATLSFFGYQLYNATAGPNTATRIIQEEF